MVDTAQFDLNLVRIFVLLYETRSVTATAEAVHVSQPTVSYSLRKLRRHFDDTLFLRGRNGLESTAVADRLYEPFQQSLAEIQEVAATSRGFDPAGSHTRFTIGLSDLGQSSLLPRLLRALRDRAPGVSLRVHELDTTGSPRQLSRGELDAFVATPFLSAPQIRRIPLFGEGYLAMVAEDHPRVTGQEVSAAQLGAERHVLVDGPSGHLGPRLALRDLDLLDRVAVQITEFSVLPYLVQDSELVAVVPEHAGRVYAASHPIRLVRLPISLERLEIALYALPERARNPAQRWLVDFLYETLAERGTPRT